MDRAGARRAPRELGDGSDEGAEMSVVEREGANGCVREWRGLWRRGMSSVLLARDDADTSGRLPGRVSAPAGIAARGAWGSGVG